MFERYTEKARRSIFFARYEASVAGWESIETIHLLLGLLRDKGLLGGAVNAAKLVNDIRVEMVRDQLNRTPLPTSVDLPLSDESKRVLERGAEESDRLGHGHIGTEHLLLGLLREEGSLAARLLKQHGVELEAFRERISSTEAQPATALPEKGTPADRQPLHALIDTLPESVLNSVKIMLALEQTWPNIKDRSHFVERFLETMARRGMATGSSILKDSSGMLEGSRGSSRTEDGAEIRETEVTVHGHEIALTERFKISEDSRQLKYTQQLRGPKREHDIEIDFDLT